MTDYTIGYVEKTENQITINCALYSNYNESKSALLSIISAMGLQLMGDPMISEREVRDLANATIDLMVMPEEAMVPQGEDNIRSFGTDHTLFFMKQGDTEDLKTLIGEGSMPISVRTIADHRKCTIDFCYGSIESTSNLN